MTSLDKFRVARIHVPKHSYHLKLEFFYQECPLFWGFEWEKHLDGVTCEGGGSWLVRGQFVWQICVFISPTIYIFEVHL